MAYWLMKSEPDAFSIDDLERVGTEPWDGIRNYQARNMIRDEMKPGDQAFFYHSNTKVPGIVGIMEIVSEPKPDPTAFDPDEKYYDPKSDPDKPRWYLVDVKYVRHTRRVIPLTELKADPALEEMPLVRRGNRLSVMPVTEEQFEHILSLEERAKAE
ncbi:MAG: EVE domain-containing protein [Guyparkeria sp.]|uniref:EVE domain-containing protein n=1 Tax=Guyparkeria sp. TaxID=2035736 RepID=UPI00397C10F7